jgi:hypothetical protein
MLVKNARENTGPEDPEDLPPLAELFLHIMLFVLPRNSFDRDRAALLRLSQIRKNLVEHMHACSGAFALDLNVSASNVVMVSPYPQCHMACFNKWHLQALKATAARFRSVGTLSIDLAQMPVGCNFIDTHQIVDLVLHCVRTGRARHIHISHAIFEADRFTDGLRHLFPHSRNQILSLSLRDCRLAINSKLLRELAGLHNLRHLTLDGNKFHLAHSGFPAFPASLETLSVARCSGLRPTLLKHLQKTLRTLTWSSNLILDADKPAFLDWIADSHLHALYIDDCGFHSHDAPAFQAAFLRMPRLESLSMAGNDHFEDAVFWWIYDRWKHREIRAPFFSVHVSNMQICYPEAAMPVILASSRFGYLELHSY